jgi:hypothetical protein
MKFVWASVACLLLLIWFAWGIAENSVVNFPRIPDVLGGYTTPYETKGIIVFLTPSQSMAMRWLSRAAWSSLAILLAAALAQYIIRRRR